MKRSLIFTAFILFLGLNVSSAYAGGTADYSVEISKKLGRGGLTLLSSPMVIPCAIQNDVSEKGAIGVGTGLFKGLGLFLRRAFDGITQIGTFIIPVDETYSPVCPKKPAPTVQA